jgi:aconitate decarboxylase
MATLSLARWATTLSPSSLPPSVQQAALRSLYNYIGCAIGGSNHPTVTKAHKTLSPFFGPPSSTLLGSTGTSKTDAQHAALLNGIASHVHDYDDTHLATIIHPTGPVASALLAYAEYAGNISGQKLLCALTAGIEASCKLGIAVWPEHYDIGWHITSTTGSISAAVGVGKLMNLSEEQMAHAIGLAAVQVVGLREMFGSDTKSFHPGRAAQSGLMAAILAEQGYTSSLQALESKRGWANVVAGGGTPKLDQYIAELGSKWEIERNAFKPFPCGIVCHPAIDGCIQLHSDLHSQDLSIDDIEALTARVHTLVIELTSKRTPKDGLEGKFSVFHGAAIGLLYGKAGPAQYADEVVRDPAVIAVRDKIEAVADEKLLADETYLTVHMKDGRQLEKHVRHAVGSLEVPMTDEQLTSKFVDQAALVLGDAEAKRASDAAWKIGKAGDVAAVVKSL